MRQRAAVHGLAMLRGLQLAGLAAAGLLVLIGQLAAFLPGFGLGMIFLLPGPILLARRFTGYARTRLDRWTGVAAPADYVPEPPPPQRQPDGYYRHDRQLYRGPRLPRFMQRLEWVLGDMATFRDLRWQLLNPLTGGLLALLPAALLIGGPVLLWRGLPSWAAVPGVDRGVAAGVLGCLALLLGPVLAPAAVRASGYLSRALLTRGGRWRQTLGSRAKGWFQRQGMSGMRVLSLLGLSLLGLPLLVLTVLGLLFGYGLGLIFLISPALSCMRWLANWRRHLAGTWSDVPVPRPYLPRPPLVRRPDGMYQVGKHLYQTEQMAAFHQRLLWLTRDRATWRDILWLETDPIVALLLLVPPTFLVVYGIWGLAMPRLWMTLLPIPDYGNDWYGKLGGSAAAAIPAGLLLAWLGGRLSPLVLRLHGRWTALLLAPTRGAQLAQRVATLTRSRADAVDAQAAELRRIERDLHDGAQARLVALGMTLGAVEQLVDTDPAAAKALLARGRESAQTALRELRELVRGIYPPVLAERGLADAVRALALDTPLPVTVTADLPQRLSAPLESAAYFAVAEALTNAARHAGANAVAVELTADAVLRITVADDGTGGADPARGSGLRGIERRLGMFDGVLTVDSPPGGPTRLTMEIPCASSSPRTSTSSERA
ncbi:sensor histidine kinase [Catellatospora tritici]|uniref:sensor histidine kinase n=1 Tax=Catellatospora tritici TaxID=2851566 RepID=UPI001C2D007D|nr:sensor histidine kinase [Catellatospora tritici]